MANALAMSSLLGSKSAVAARPAAFSGKARSTRVQVNCLWTSATFKRCRMLQPCVQRGANESSQWIALEFSASCDGVGIDISGGQTALCWLYSASNLFTLCPTFFMVLQDIDRKVSLLQARFVTVSAADRQVWFPGNAPAPHLDGSMPGDYG